MKAQKKASCWHKLWAMKPNSFLLYWACLLFVSLHWIPPLVHTESTFPRTCQINVTAIFPFRRGSEKTQPIIQERENERSWDLTKATNSIFITHRERKKRSSLRFVSLCSHQLAKLWRSRLLRRLRRRSSSSSASPSSAEPSTPPNGMAPWTLSVTFLGFYNLFFLL